MSFDELKSAIGMAIEKLKAEDKYLLDVVVSERSLTHRLAVYLEQLPVFSGWNIDCEYNRNGDVPKFLKGLGRLALPDIVVHKRGAAGPNLLVIEAKKTGQHDGDDEAKVKAYIQDLRYRYGLCLIFNGGNVESKWFEGT